MEELGLTEAVEGSQTQLLIAHMGASTQPDHFAMAQQLREEGWVAELYPTAARLKKQMAYASRIGIRFFILRGAGTGCGQSADQRPARWGADRSHRIRVDRPIAGNIAAYWNSVEHRHKAVDLFFPVDQQPLIDSAFHRGVLFVPIPKFFKWTSGFKDLPAPAIEDEQMSIDVAFISVEFKVFVLSVAVGGEYIGYKEPFALVVHLDQCIVNQEVATYSIQNPHADEIAPWIGEGVVPF